MHTITFVSKETFNLNVSRNSQRIFAFKTMHLKQCTNYLEFFHVFRNSKHVEENEQLLLKRMKE